MKNTIKRIFAIIGIIIILGWILASFLIAVLPIPAKATLLPVFIAGCVIFPIALWIALWLIGVVTKKKNIASFRTEEMEDTMLQAEQIKYNQAHQNDEPAQEPAPEDFEDEKKG